MTNLAVSIVIPTYNRADFISRAIASALVASAPEDEIIVVDDGSTDGTQEVIASFRERIRVVHIPHGGAGRARNVGVKEATRPLIAFLDSDDEWLPYKLELQRTFMETRPDVLFCFTDFAVRDHSGREHRKYLFQWHKDSRPWDEILGPGVPFSSVAPLPAACPDFRLHVGNLFPAQMAAGYVCTCTLVVRRDAAGEALQFPEDLPLYEDWECFSRLARKGPAAYLDCETFWNYGHASPRLTDADILVRATTRITILERVWGSDPAFLTEYGPQYTGVLNAQRLMRVRGLIRAGRTQEARMELRSIEHLPLVYRVLGLLPASLAQSLRGIRGLLRPKNR